MKDTYRNIIILVFAVILGMVLNDAQKYNYISDVGLMISFFGILATFVVISNYAQAKEAKDKVEQMEASITKIWKDIYDDNEQPVFKKDNTQRAEEIKEVAKKLIQENNQRYDNIVNVLLEGLVPEEHVSMVKTIIKSDGIYNCTIVNPRTGRDIIAKVQLNANNNIIFKNRNNEEVANVGIINGNPYEEAKIHQVIKIWKEIQKMTKEETAVLDAIFPQAENGA